MSDIELQQGEEQLPTDVLADGEEIVKTDDGHDAGNVESPVDSADPLPPVNEEGAIQWPVRHYVTEKGVYIGSFGEGPGATFPANGIWVPYGPESYDQPWLFPGWGPSISLMSQAEDAWRTAELLRIAAQLDALEETEAGEEPEDLLPGSRPAWLKYRGQVRNWVTGAVNYPHIEFRPTRPTK